jgi:hypothetical protein
LLELGEGTLSPDAVRAAYVRRAQIARLGVDPDGFMRLRVAFECLSRAAGAPSDEVTASRAWLATEPDSQDARWTLLSYFQYGSRPEALPILCEGAERRPDEFLDELLFHFPEKVQAGVLRGARDGAGYGRLLLIADVHAVQGRPADALEIFRAALVVADLRSPAALKLATRPIFSLHEHAQIGPASEALSLLKDRVGQAALEAQKNIDWATATTFRIADELDRLGPSIPLDFRQVAARAVRRGDFENAPYDARFAMSLLKPREGRKLSERLKREAPTLAKTLGLDLRLEQMRPTGTPNFRIPIRLGLPIAVVGLALALRIHGIQKRRREFDEILRSAGHDFVEKSLGDIRTQIERDCEVPDSTKCQYWRTFFSNGNQNVDGGTVPDAHEQEGQLGLDDIGTIGTRSTSPKTRHHPVRGHDLP